MLKLLMLVTAGVFLCLTTPRGYCQAANVTAEYINKIPQADQFCGGAGQPVCTADMCTKLRAANIYAVTNNINQVDATHFIGVQSCSVDPFKNIATTPTPINLIVNFGAVHIQSAVPWDVNNSSVTLHGMGATLTQLEYTGSTQVNAVLSTQTTSVSGLYNVNITGMFAYGGVSNAKYGYLIENTAHSTFDGIMAWGATTCGIQTWGAVTNTFLHPKVSYIEAGLIGIDDSAHTTPTDGLCFDVDPNSPNYQTTNSTVIDAGAEGLPGVGWHVENAQTMTFTSGTSEHNGRGIYVSATNSKFNTFLDSDIEGNGSGSYANTNGVDVYDIGNLNTYINLLATTSCSGCNSVLLTGAAGQQFLLGGYQATSASGPGMNGIAPIGFKVTSATSGSASPLPSTPAGYWIVQLLGSNIKIPYYN
jgi:hypothetical protein